MADDPWAAYPKVGQVDDPWAAYPKVEPAQEPRTAASAPRASARELARAFLYGASQTVSGGTSDEMNAYAHAAVRAVGGDAFWKAVDEERGKVRAEAKDLEAKAPWTTFAGRAAGTVPLALAAPALLPGAGGVGTAAARGIATGFGSGLVSGFGEGEGGFLNRAMNAAKSGTIGAMGGAVLGPASHLVGRAIEKVWPSAPDRARALVEQGLADEPGPELPVNQPGRLPATRQQPGAERAAEEIREANAAGVPNMTIADVSKRGQGLARDVAAAPNPAQTRLNDFYGSRQSGKPTPGAGREGGQLNRITELLTQESGVGRRRAIPALAELEKEQKEVAGPMFRQAERMDVTNLPEAKQLWQELMGTKVGPAVREKIRARWKYELKGQRLPPLNARVTPDFRAFKMAKEALDDEVKKLFRSGDNSEAIAAAQYRDHFRDTLRTVNPKYGEALQKYAGTASLEDATEAGRLVMRRKPEEIAQDLARLTTDSERQAYRTGAISELTDQLGRKPEGEMTDFTHKLRTPDIRNRVYALMPDDAARERIDRNVMGEHRQSKTAATFGGSQTQPRAQVAASVEELSPAAAFLKEASGLPTATQLLGMGVKKGYDRVKRSPATRGELGKILELTDEDALSWLEELSKPRKRPAGGARGGVVAGTMAPAGLDLLGYDPLSSIRAPR